MADHPVDVVLLVASATPAGAAGRPVMLGLKAFGLEARAAEVGAVTLLKDPNWKQSVLALAANEKARVLVSLDGFAGATTIDKVMKAVQAGATKAGRPTEWEMAQLYGAGRMKQVEFYQSGKAVRNPF